MMSKKPGVTFILFISLLWCTSMHTQTVTPLGNGKIRVVTKVDGVDREYFIHQPKIYDGTKVVPLVFMLHGTSGDGETFYNAYGWTELADAENFIAVFPSSGKYKINDNGELKNITKWNTVPDADWTFQPGEKPLNDIKFLRQVIDEIKANFKIDAKRIYLNGFSNGGQMAANCSIEMSDVLAAVCSNASAFFIDTIYRPKRKLPVLYEVGNQDYGSGNEGPQVPMNLFDSLISTPGIAYQNGKHYRVDNNYVRNFNLKREHIITGDTALALIATHQPNNPGPGTGYEFKFIFIKGLDHQYPNGKIHPFNAPVIHWNWMKQYVLEDTIPAAEGKKLRIVTKVEGVDREYFIHLPAHYNNSKEYPMVMFFHGSGQDGNLFYNISGWNEVADTAGIIMVYPSALTYCQIDKGVEKYDTKFTAYPQSGDPFCAGQKLKDDIVFVKTILNEMTTEYKIDARRIYTVGFSNGGEMASRCALELGDKIAACVASGGGGSLPRDTVLVPKRKLPMMNMFGNKDDHIITGLGLSENSVPMGFTVLYTKYPVLYAKQVMPYVNVFNLDDKNYVVQGDTNSVVVSIFKGKSNEPLNVFWNVEVKNLEHEYPNGVNHPLKAAPYHWTWLYQYKLPLVTSTIHSTNQFHALKIFPNPASSQINIPGVKHFIIYDVLGKMVFKGHEEKVDIGLWTNGLYFVQTEHGLARFLKQ